MVSSITTKQIILGKMYMVETNDGKTQSLRIISETESHYIFSVVTDQSNEVFEKAKSEIIGIYDIKEWCDANPQEKNFN